MSKLGIFWIHQDNIFVLQEESNTVETIYEVKDIETGHVDYWEDLQKEHSCFQNLGYDQVPRGRVLQKGEKIFVYSSEKIINNYQDLILESFELLNNTVEFISDEHYAPILDLGYEQFDYQK